MQGLQLVNDQLESVSRSIDWSRHGEEMVSLDAEVAELNQKIALVLSLHLFVVELDAICIREIDAGKASPDAEAHRLLDGALRKFQQTGAEIVAEAEGFIRKGIPITGIASLRKIVANPGDDLGMVRMMRAAEALGEQELPREAPFDESVFRTVEEKGARYRHIGNE